MKTIVFFLLTMICLSAKSQTNHIVKDSIVSRFNRGDLKGIYAMAGTGFKTEVTEDQLVNLLQGATAFGKISGTEIIDTDSANVSAYKLLFPKKSLQLNLRASASLSYDVFGLGFYKLPVVRTRKHFLSDNKLATQLDSVVQDAVRLYMSNKNVAGLSVGILRNGELHTYNFGETKKGNGVVPSNRTIYEIGSVTKTFTGILLAKAVLDKKVSLQDDIRKYLRGSYPNLEYAGQPIRLVHLSNHTSRLPSQPKIPGTQEDPFSPLVQFTDTMLNDILHKVTIDTLPGTRREYSNFAVGLLGIILEKAYGLNYEQLLEKYILSPYNMQQTKIGLNASDFAGFAQGYDVEGNPAGYWRNRIAEPDGGIRSTTHDMLLYMKAQLNPSDSAAWLSHQLSFGDAKRGSGLNWGISTTKEGLLRWAHDGGTDGFTSYCVVYPELNAGIILLSNHGDHGDQSFFDIVKPIYANWLKR